MKSKSLTLFLVALATFLPAIASAGEFRGTLTKDGAPVRGAVIKIKITSGNNAPHMATTDRSGFYRVFVPEIGSGTLTVTIDQKEFPALTVTSYDRFVQNDLIVKGEEVTKR
jgi:hypothetical protein